MDGGSAGYSAWFFPQESFFPSPSPIPARIHRCSRVLEAFRGFEDAVAEDSCGLESDSWLELVRSRLIVGVDENESSLAVPFGKLWQVIDFLHANAFHTISLDELANLGGVSRYHLLREFKRMHGLPPHAYQEGLRIERAKQLLSQGELIADVAQAVGFSDQAHLTRRMKRLTGYAPGQLVKASNNVQDC